MSQNVSIIAPPTQLSEGRRQLCGTAPLRGLSRLQATAADACRHSATCTQDCRACRRGSQYSRGLPIIDAARTAACRRCCSAPAGCLIADPARSVPGIGAAIALDNDQRRGDAARDAMLAEAGIHLDAPSAFAAHDVARVAVAALRQLAALADTAARHAAMVRPTSYDPAVRELFAELADAFEELYGRRYSVSNTPCNVKLSGRASRPGGPGPRWTLALFRHAADAAAGMPCEPALRRLASHSAQRPDGLAKRIRDARHLPRKRMHSYRRASGGIKHHLTRDDF